MESLNQFHFIRPWLLILIPATVIVWLMLKRLSTSSQWQDHLPKAVVEALRISKSRSAKLSQWCWLTVWVLISVATAGPSWLKQAVPVLQNQNATVIILDLSLSMLAKDLTPNRLTLAKYKLIDVLRHGTKDKSVDGQIALVAYSGGAYTVSPLTDDPKTIEALLPALHPNVMPSLGSNVEAAVDLAKQLLSDAGIPSGQILLLTDGVAKSAFDSIEDQLSGQHRLSILGVGSNAPAPVPLDSGGFMRTSNGEIVLASLNAPELQTLSRKLGGKFAQISTNETDLNFLLNNDFSAGEQSDNVDDNSFDAWSDMGHWILLLILPIFLLFFRKGLVYVLPLLSVSLLFTPTDSYAASMWDKLWKNRDQQGAELIQKEDYQAAADTFKSDEWSAHAAYKNADYATTIERLERKNDPKNLYNKANALALNGAIDDAIETYKKVLELNADHADAHYNLEILEQLKKQQQDQQQGDENSEQNSEENNQDQSEQGESQEAQSEQESPEQSDQQDPNQQSQDPEPTNSEPQSEQEAQEKNQQDTPEENSDDEDSMTEDPSENKDSKDESSDQASQAQQQKEALVESPEPLKDSSEQWLRSIEDDPSGLLRRKFEFQSQQRQRQGRRSRQQKDDSGAQRY